MFSDQWEQTSSQRSSVLSNMSALHFTLCLFSHPQHESRSSSLHLRNLYFQHRPSTHTHSHNLTIWPVWHRLVTRRCRGENLRETPSTFTGGHMWCFSSNRLLMLLFTSDYVVKLLQYLWFNVHTLTLQPFCRESINLLLCAWCWRKLKINGNQIHISTGVGLYIRCLIISFY